MTPSPSSRRLRRAPGLKSVATAEEPSADRHCSCSCLASAGAQQAVPRGAVRHSPPVCHSWERSAGPRWTRGSRLHDAGRRPRDPRPLPACKQQPRRPEDNGGPRASGSHKLGHRLGHRLGHSPAPARAHGGPRCPRCRRADGARAPHRSGRLCPWRRAALSEGCAGGRLSPLARDGRFLLQRPPRVGVARRRTDAGGLRVRTTKPAQPESHRPCRDLHIPRCVYEAQRCTGPIGTAHIHAVHEDEGYLESACGAP
ncbi:unnamed protein product [Lampetra planeri]